MPILKVSVYYLYIYIYIDNITQEVHMPSMFLPRKNQKLKLQNDNLDSDKLQNKPEVLQVSRHNKELSLLLQNMLPKSKEKQPIWSPSLLSEHFANVIYIF